MANPDNNDSTFEEYFTHNVSPFQPRNALLHSHRVDAAILPADLFAASTSKPQIDPQVGSLHRLDANVTTHFVVETGSHCE